MPQHVRPDALHIFRRHISPALQQRPGFRGHGQVNGGAWGSAELDEMFQVELVLLWFARRKNEVNNVIPNFFIDVDLIDELGLEKYGAKKFPVPA